MIKVKSKRDKSGKIALNVSINGTWEDVVHEAFTILTELPKSIGEENPALLKIITDEIHNEIEKMKSEEDTDNE